MGIMACEVPRCRDEEEINYLGHWLCDKHWAQKAEGKKLKMKYGKVI